MQLRQGVATRALTTGSIYSDRMECVDVTTPHRSRWDQEDAEFVASDATWVHRCAQRMVEKDGFLDLEQALSLALELSSTSAIRARSPERVAEDMLRTVDVGLN